MDITFSSCPQALGVLIAEVRKQVREAVKVRDQIDGELASIVRYERTMASAGGREVAKRMYKDASESKAEAEAVLASWASLYRALVVNHHKDSEFISRMCEELGIGPAH